MTNNSIKESLGWLTMRKAMTFGFLLAIFLAADARVQNQTRLSNAPNPSDTAQSATQAAHAARIHVAAKVQATKLIRRVYPVYPVRAAMERITGTVVCRAIISTDGLVEELEYVSGPQPLRQAAMDAMKLWRYAPTVLNGQSVEVETTIEQTFSLGNTPQAQSESSVPWSDRSIVPLQPVPDEPYLRVAGDDQRQKIVYMVQPVPPPDSHVNGTVVFRAVIARDGSVSALEYVSGPPLLMVAAMNAVRQWRYQPTKLNGNAIEVETTISVTFKFDKSGKLEPQPNTPKPNDQSQARTR